MCKNVICSLLFLIILICEDCYSQKSSLFQGTWYGKAYMPGSKIIQKFDAVLDVFSISGNAFEGTLKTILPADTSIHLDVKISGIIYEKYLIIRLHEILYVKNPKGNIKWETKCDSCNPPQMIFSIEKEKFILRGEVKGCLRSCNGIREFSRDLSEFDSSTRDSLYALINGTPKPETSDTISLASKLIAATSKEASITTIPQKPASSEKLNTTLSGAPSLPISTDNTALLISQKISALSKDATVVSLPRKSPVFISQKINAALPNQPALSVSFETNSSLLSEKIAASSKDATIVSIPRKNTALPLQKTNILVWRKPALSTSMDNSRLVSQKIAATSKGATVVRIPRKKLIVFSQQPKTLTRQKPALRVSMNNTSLLKKIAATLRNDSIAVAQQKEVPVPQNVNVPVPQKTAVSLPSDFNERKINVIRTLEVNTDSVILKVYDNGVVDGDIVSVIYNRQVIVDKLSLTTRALTIKIGVNKSGKNTLVFHAHNLGEFPPNTAKLEILYGDKKEELTVASDFTVSSDIDLIYSK